MPDKTKSLTSAAIILAAGKGTRMQSNLPKVLHRIGNRPMLSQVIDAADKAGCGEMVVVVGPKMKAVEDVALAAHEGCKTVLQQKQLGTGHAVLCAQKALEAHEGHFLILYGDTPLITPKTLQTMLDTLNKTPHSVVVLGMRLSDPAQYGRLVVGENGELHRIVEFKDASEEEKAITLCNSGVMAVRGGKLFELLEQVSDDNAKGEYYLTDIVGLARGMMLSATVIEADASELVGINTRAELAQAEAALQQRLRSEAMDAGVTMVAPETVFFSADTQLGKDVVIHPNVVFGPDVTVGDGVEIKSFCHLEGAVIADKAIIGPYARLRPGAGIGESAHIGNFVEIKNSQIERGAKINHHSYIGDAHVGEEANVGAGTITCNYDGFSKHHTDIGKQAFIGSNTALVAPVSVGDGAYVAAGSVVTENVEADALAINRPAQQVKEQWARKHRERNRKDDRKDAS